MKAFSEAISFRVTQKNGVGGPVRPTNGPQDGTGGRTSLAPDQGRPAALNRRFSTWSGSPGGSCEEAQTMTEGRATWQQS